jgi:hypothetical protein
MTEASVAPTLHDMLASILSQEDLDTAYIVAGAINLYYEAMSRRDNRRRFGPQDAQGLLSIIHTLTAVPGIEQDIAQLYGRPTRKQEVSQ